MEFRKVPKEFAYGDDDMFEKFGGEESKKAHYKKHCKDGNATEKQFFTGVSEDEYEAMADELAIKPVDSKNIFGYESIDSSGNINYVKWDKNTALFVTYSWKDNEPEPNIKSCYIKEYRYYHADKSFQYVGEIPKGK